MKKSSLNTLASDIYSGNVAKGFYDTPREIGTLLMLVNSELCEALEADRTGKINSLPKRIPNIKSDKFPKWFEDNVKNTFNDEIADAMIRLLDLCGYLGIDIDKHIKLKLAYNKTRSYKHGKKY